MTKLEAIQELAHEARNHRPSKTSLKRTRKAGKVLGLSDDDQFALEL